MRKSFRCFLRMRSRFWDLTNMQRFFFFLNWIVKHLSNFQAWEFLSFLFTHTIGHLRMNFRGQSGESPLRLTPQFDEHKSQSAVSGSVVYKKTPAPFKMGKERGEKVRWQKAGRRHYEPAMSDELFRDSNRPRATWFIDCSERKKKSANLSCFPHCLQFVTQRKHMREKKLRLRANTCWFTTCWALRSAAAESEGCCWRHDGVWS